jgi:three-Cys-motif partner protein
MANDMTDRLPTLDDDGLYTPEVGDWAEQKYRLVSSYATMFSTAMRGKWHRVYIDLFAGAGRAHIKNTQRIVPASPMLALNVPNKFDLYIFCEKEKKIIDTLKKRVSKSYSDVNSRFLHGDANSLTNRILKEIPQARRGFNVLAFCFADPFALENLAFDTIHQLSSRFMDFLILIPTGMDAVRNISHYVREFKL